MIIKECDKGSLQTLANSLGLKNVPGEKLKHFVMEAINTNAIICKESPIDDSTDVKQTLLTSPKWIKELRSWEVGEEIIKKLVKGGIVSKEDINLFEIDDFVYCGLQRPMAIKLYRRLHSLANKQCLSKKNQPEESPHELVQAPSPSILPAPPVPTLPSTNYSNVLQNFQRLGITVRTPITQFELTRMTNSPSENCNKSSNTLKPDLASDDHLVPFFDPTRDDLTQYLAEFRRKMSSIDPTKITWVPKLYVKLHGEPKNVAERAIQKNCCIKFEELVQILLQSIPTKDKIRKAHAQIEQLKFNQDICNPILYCDKLAGFIKSTSASPLPDEFVSFCVYLKIPQNYQTQLREEAHMGMKALRKKFNQLYEAERTQKKADKRKKEKKKAQKQPANGVPATENATPQKLNNLSRTLTSPLITPSKAFSPGNEIIPLSDFLSNQRLSTDLEYSFNNLLKVANPPN